MRKATCLLLTTTLTASFLLCPVKSYAEPIEHSSKQETFKINQEISNLEDEVEKMDNQIVEMIYEMDSLNKQIKQGKKKADQLEKEIDLTEKKYEKEYHFYEKRLIAIQESDINHSGIIDALLSSDSITNFISRMFVISNIIESDQENLSLLEEHKENLTKDQKELTETVHSLSEEKKELKEKKKTIEKDKKKVLHKVEALKEKKKKLKEKIKRSSFNLNNTNSSIISQTKNEDHFLATTLSQSKISSPDQEKTKELITEAVKYLGTPYKWGGTTPKGFDCSGFTQYVFHSVGVDLPRTSKQQQNVGEKIPLSEIKPGDLIFRGNPAHHVAIYLGNGKYIHAPHTGDVVKISKFNPSYFTSATRVL